jgi:hypothetical protein
VKVKLPINVLLVGRIPLREPIVPIGPIPVELNRVRFRLGTVELNPAVGFGLIAEMNTVCITVSVII